MEKRRVYLTEQYHSEFGQTEAGAHSCSSAEKVICSAPLWAGWPGDPGRKEAREEQARLMEEGMIHLVVSTRDNGRVEVPFPKTAEGFQQMASLVLKRTREDHWWVACFFGPHELRVIEPEKLALKGASVEMDPGNLAYQRALLRGEA